MSALANYGSLVGERTINGRHITRFARRCQVTGCEAPAWREVVPPPTNFWAQVRVAWARLDTDGERFSRSLASTYARKSVTTCPEADSLEGEARRLRDEYRLLNVAAVLDGMASAKRKTATGRAGKVFDPGDVYIAKYADIRSPFGDGELMGLVARHANGDAGTYGTAWDALKLTEDQSWCPPLFDVGTQNRAALDSGYGIIRSRFDRVVGTDAWVEVATFVAPGRAHMTLAFGCLDQPGF